MRRTGEDVEERNEVAKHMKNTFILKLETTSHTKFINAKGCD
jgi:hypothetical protein